ncbi:hypothetical protein [Candidatus Methylacidiphilum infernorum]|uniref:Uncharacterized protein n=1 Tax=Methylacidiphilum infernorum (isolate V4) TaxID=481448 RepID=B3DUW7_METI4|nr:hypothetical protein [Candidatus Methylacidiphilum infernorum]ACD83120.1 Hypothetical protein Minf_1065 [Methylacidiphilum infernorum V4]
MPELHLVEISFWHIKVKKAKTIDFLFRAAALWLPRVILVEHKRFTPVFARVDQELLFF